MRPGFAHRFRLGRIGLGAGMRLFQQAGVVYIVWQDLDSAACGMRDSVYIRLLRVTYSWPMGLGCPWPRTTLCRELFVDNREHGQDSQTHQGHHNLGRQHPTQGECAPSIKDTPQASADRGVDKSSRDNADKRAEYKGR